jgi:hypothetical protein
MIAKNIDLGAYYESAKVYTAYTLGYTCETMKLSESDYTQGSSKIISPDDLDFIQAIFSGKPQAIVFEQTNKAIEVAKKLLKIHTAGACALSILNAKENKDAQSEIELLGKDARYVGVLQLFLKQHDTQYKENDVDGIMQLQYNSLKQDTVWKSIDFLAQRILKSEDHQLTRFYIEDTLMASGFKIVKQASHHALSVKEEKEEVYNEPIISSRSNVEIDLDNRLKKFLLLLKKDLNETEINESIIYLKSLFEKG